MENWTSALMYKVYICKFCHIKVSSSYLKEHLFAKHFDRLYEGAEAGKQEFIETFLTGEENTIDS